MADPSSVSNGSPAASSPPIKGSQQGSQLNPRSCTTCRRRKVKCDKRSPCSNCQKAHIPCVFPERNRAPRRARKPSDNELLKRLAKLEGVVEELSGQVVDTPVVGRAPSVSGSGGEGEKDGTDMTPGEQGRLLIDGEGRSRYVSNGFWASLSREFDDIRTVLVEDDSDNDYPSPSTGSNIAGNSRDGFIFGQSNLVGSLREYHPTPEQVGHLWQVFTTNIDPVLKIVHRPTFEVEVMKAKDNLDNLSRAMETLMFSIYFAAVTSLAPDECMSIMLEEKTVLLDKYRWATEQALARAGFLDTKEMGILQAFVMFLICVRRHTESRRVWTLTGLAIRIGQSLGIHRDGTVFGLSPFETEMRRRLWWQICILDIRSAEDDGSDPSIAEFSFDTQLPLNLNDADISPDTPTMPPSREGCTEMAFCLVRFETCSALRRLNNVVWHGYGPEGAKARPAMTMKEKEKLIEDTQRRVEEKYLAHCDMSVPLNWVSGTIIRLIMAKVYLLLHQPFQHADGGASLPQETKDILFSRSCDVIEYSDMIKNETSTIRYGWLFKSYVQWHAVAFILSELCVRTRGPDIERAWRAVDTVFREAARYEIETDTKRSHLWRPLDKLFAKAKRVHQAEWARQQRAARQAQAGVGLAGRGVTPALEERGMQYWRSLEASLARGGPLPGELSGSVAPRLLDMTMEALDLNLNPFMPGDGITASIEGLNVDGVVGAMEVEMEMEEEHVDWGDWDMVVRDFQMQLDAGLSEEPGGGGGVVGGGGGLW